MKRLLISLTLLCVGLSSYGQKTITVNGFAEGYDYKTIQDAVDNAAEGDIILVHGSENDSQIYDELVVIKTSVRLIGEGFGQNQDLRTHVSKITIQESAPNTTIGSFSLDNVVFASVGNELRRCFASNIELKADGQLISQSELGTISGNSTINHVFTNDIFRQTSTVEMSNITIKYCVSLGNGDFPVDKNSAAVITNSIVIRPDVSSTGVGIVYWSYPNTFEGGRRNLIFRWGSTDDSWQNKLRLSDPSIARKGGNEAGIYGGSTPFIIDGKPPVSQISDLTAPTVISPGQQMTISFRVNGN